MLRVTPVVGALLRGGVAAVRIRAACARRRVASRCGSGELRLVDRAAEVGDLEGGILDGPLDHEGAGHDGGAEDQGADQGRRTGILCHARASFVSGFDQTRHALSPSIRSRGSLA